MIKFKIHYSGANIDVNVELEPIKRYPRYTLYQVYKVNGYYRQPVYRMCFSDLDLNKILEKGELNI